MNRINFIKPVPPSRAREVRIWYWLSLITGCFLFLSITIITGMQWYLYIVLHKQKSEIQTGLVQFETIKSLQQKQQAERDMMHHQIDTINRYKTNPKNPHAIFATVCNALKNIDLHSASINKDRFEINVVTSDARHIPFCIKQLDREAAFADICLVSLQTNENKIDAIIKGTIKTKLRT